MCLAVPGEIIAAQERLATVAFRGIQQQVCLDLLPDAQVGDFVLVHAGFAIERIDPEAAREITSLFDELNQAGRDEKG